MNYLFFYLNKFLNKTTAKMAFHAFVQSRISYGIIAWGSTYNVHHKKITSLQNNIIKNIYKDSKTKENDLLNPHQLQILKIINYYKKHEKDFSYKMCNNRNKKTMKLAIPKIEKFRQSHMYVYTKIFDKIPQ
jgi:hypothetical protein